MIKKMSVLILILSACAHSPKHSKTSLNSHSNSSEDAYYPAYYVYDTDIDGRNVASIIPVSALQAIVKSVDGSEKAILAYVAKNYSSFGYTSREVVAGLNKVSDLSDVAQMTLFNKMTQNKGQFLKFDFTSALRKVREKNELLNVIATLNEADKTVKTSASIFLNSHSPEAATIVSNMINKFPAQKDQILSIAKGYKQSVKKDPSKRAVADALLVAAGAILTKTEGQHLGLGGKICDKLDSDATNNLLKIVLDMSSGKKNGDILKMHEESFTQVISGRKLSSLDEGELGFYAKKAEEANTGLCKAPCDGTICFRR